MLILLLKNNKMLFLSMFYINIAYICIVLVAQKQAL